MPTKIICVLANSVKAKGCCIAGRVVEKVTDKGWRFKKEWIRPISHRTKGELNDEESYLTTLRRTPRHFDIVEFDSDGRAEVIGQPEDFLITEGNRWRHLGKLNDDAVEGFLETPKNLWVDGANRRDRAAPAFIQAGDLPSLYLIKPESFQAHIDKTTWGGKVIYLFERGIRVEGLNRSLKVDVHVNRIGTDALI